MSEALEKQVGCAREGLDQSSREAFARARCLLRSRSIISYR